MKLLSSTFNSDVGFSALEVDELYMVSGGSSSGYVGGGGGGGGGAAMGGSGPGAARAY